MPIIRCKTRNSPFVVADKGFLTNATLSLRAKGLLILLLSFPDDWNISIRDLEKRTREGRDSLRTVTNELIRAGYLIRSSERTKVGQFAGYEYTVYELPVSPRS